MAFSMVPGSKGERAAVVGTSYFTGVAIALLDKKKPSWTTPVTAVTTVVGAGMMLAGKGVVATIGEGFAAGGAALLGAATPSWFTKSESAASHRVGAPVRMAARVDVRQTQNIMPVN
jgi:drug/metabolite transporter (DMT)-like permease